MIEPVTISNNTSLPPGMDFDFLREEGIKRIREFAGEVWTDYNTHDPGITILEHLCYAITDLSYRLSFDMKDLLAFPQEDNDKALKNFFTAKEILTSNPVTINDYRKLLIDIDGVKNAWLEKIDRAQPTMHYDRQNSMLTYKPDATTNPVSTNGLYRVLIEKDTKITNIDDEALLDEASSRLNKHRNICERFEEVNILEEEMISIKMTIDLDEDADLYELIAKINLELGKVISPEINFYTLNELLDRGQPVEHVFTGPALNNGFIDDEELKRFNKKRELYTSDLINVILDIKGIKDVRNFGIYNDSSEVEEWALALDPYKAPKLRELDSMILGNRKSFEFYKDGAICAIDETKLKESMRHYNSKITNQTQNHGSNDIEPPAGEYRYLSDYEPVQNDFPANYGIGEYGLPDSAPPERKAAAKQLKAYLMFFDQILANYFAQIDNVKTLYSYDSSDEIRAYFAQKVEGVNGIDDILNIDQAELNTITGDEKTGLKRKNMFLDQLLAMFAEKFTDISQLLYDSLKNDSNGAEFNSVSNAPEMRLIKNKSDLLKNYSVLSANRATAFNYTDKQGELNTENISGLKKNICAKLGIEAPKMERLAELDKEGFHMLEHLLLWPILFDAQSKDIILKLTKNTPPDIFSFQISFIFPKWIDRFTNDNFKALINKVILDETPIHIKCYIHWLNKDDMKVFEDTYFEWLKKNANNFGSAGNEAFNILKLLKFIT